MTRIITYIALVAAVGISALADGDMSVEPTQGIPLFLKIITYDNSYEFGETKTVNVCLPYVRRNAASYEQYRACSRFFEKNKDTRVSGARVNFIPFQLSEIESMKSKIQSSDYNIMIFTDLNDEQVHSLLQERDELSLKTFTFNPRQLSLGVGISVRSRQKKTTIVVNLAATQVEGSRYGAHLLKMCEIYEENS